MSKMTRLGSDIHMGPTSDGGVAPSDINFDPYAGYTANGKPILPVFSSTGDMQAHIATGLRVTINNGVITYGFYTGDKVTGVNRNPHYGEAAGYAPFTAAQKAAAINAIQLWDDLDPAVVRQRRRCRS